MHAVADRRSFDNLSVGEEMKCVLTLGGGAGDIPARSQVLGSELP